jgi:phosphoribosyl 1,2-cyclic phosphodiesterase
MPVRDRRSVATLRVDRMIVLLTHPHADAMNGLDDLRGMPLCHVFYRSANFDYHVSLDARFGYSTIHRSVCVAGDIRCGGQSISLP